MSELFSFEWGVDQHGYTLKNDPPGPLVQLLRGSDEDDPEKELAYEREGWDRSIWRNGGPLRYYRPLDRPGLWRRFAKAATTPEGALAFVCEFGFLGDLFDASKQQDREGLGWIITTACRLDAIGRALDGEDPYGAAILFNRNRSRMTARIDVPKPNETRLTFELMPLSLRSALYLQAGNAITGDLKFRRCLNCPEWFQIGSGAHTVRRKFCTSRCRVAWSRRPVEERAALEAHPDG